MADTINEILDRCECCKSTLNSFLEVQDTGCKEDVCFYLLGEKQCGIFRYIKYQGYSYSKSEKGLRLTYKK